MTIPTTPSTREGCLIVRDKVVLSGVPPNVVTCPGPCGSAFIGATSDTPTSYHVFNLGLLEECRFVCLFRFKIWWMIPRFGSSASDIPIETQMLLLEMRKESTLLEETANTTDENTFYILMLPVLDGRFRASLQGSSANELQVCIESGDPDVQTSEILESVFINSGDNPYELLKESIKLLGKYKGTFSHIDDKKIPENLDWFGWCTWDAFYRDVNPQGIKQGLESLSAGGCPARFLIIDDGWQQSVDGFRKDNEPAINGTEFAERLVDLKENKKFRNREVECDCNDLSQFVKAIKEKYGVKYVYVWHALVGYWGGLCPSAEAMKKYNPKIKYPLQSPGDTGNVRDIAMDNLDRYGVGLIDPSKIYEFYNDLHEYLAKCGVDGVKVDVQNVIETMGTGYGGRVSLTRQYQQALESSIVKNFKDNNLICCMCHNTDSIYSSKKSAVARASEDFMPREVTFQTLHVASVAFNSLLLGEIFVPDWDMFYSNHATAEFHGAARAVGGCGVYVSDEPGVHDFNLLKKIVLPDGSFLRARYAGRPTKDCLFVDSVMDGKSLLKIWNMNKFSGVVGVFNCQGSGRWPCRKRAQNEPLTQYRPPPITGRVSPTDVDFLKEVAGENWNGDCVVYGCNSKSITRTPKKGSVAVTLDVVQCEVYTISPIKEYNGGVHFAPLGLINMYNSGGAIEELNCSNDYSGCKIKIKVHGCGQFGAYSSIKPRYCMVNKKETGYEAKVELITLTVPPYGEGQSNLQEIEIVY